MAEATKEVAKEVKSLKEQQEELLGKIKKSTQGYEDSLPPIEQLARAIYLVKTYSTAIEALPISHGNKLRKLLATMHHISAFFDRQAHRYA